MTASADEWVASGREPSFLLHGSKLEQTEEWATGTTVALTPDDTAFLHESIRQNDADRAAEDARRAEIELERRRSSGSAVSWPCSR